MASYCSSHLLVPVSPPAPRRQATFIRLFAVFRQAVSLFACRPVRNPSPSRAARPARRFCRHAGFLMASISFMNVPCFCTLRIVIIPWSR